MPSSTRYNCRVVDGRSDPEPRRVWRVFCDGTAVPNTAQKDGAIGLGVVVVDDTGARHELSERSKQRGDNNVAEGLALVRALAFARSVGAADEDAVIVVCDSSIVVENTAGPKRTAVAGLREIFARARDALSSFHSASIENVPRRRNAEADVLARAAVGLSKKPPPKPKRRRR